MTAGKASWVIEKEVMVFVVGELRVMVVSGVVSKSTR